MKAGILILILVLSQSVITWAQKGTSHPEPTGLQIGDTVSDFTAVNQMDSTFNLKAALQDGPIVLVFYRGQWCPFCNRHLHDLQDSLKLINQTGAQVIAISPEKPEYLQKMEGKTGAEFTLLYDEKYVISEQFGVLFNPDKATKTLYNTALKADLSKAHNNENEFLPIPATYIINREGVIVWRHFDPNYKKRSSVKEILENIPQ